MVALILAVVTYLRAFFLPRHRLGLEAAALRQQLTVLKRKQPRPSVRNLDRLFLRALYGWWPDWANALFLVQADTVVSWHRLGFRLFWRLRCRFRQIGRPKVGEEIRQLIRRMKSETRRGRHPASMANCFNSDSRFTSPPSRVIRSV